jgi:membrane protease YdiL (CAAX protease family)
MPQDEGGANVAAVSGWRRAYGCAVFCMALALGCVLAVEWEAHVRLDSTRKNIQDAAFAALFALLLLPSVAEGWRFYRSNWKRMLRSWGVRMALAGVGLLLAGMAGVIVAQAVSGQREGVAQTAFGIVALAGGSGLVVLSGIVGLIEASGASIERYQELRRGTADEEQA